MSQGAVFVTGAGSGIGRATAHALRVAGHAVFAAARKAEHLAALEGEGCIAVPLDLRDAEQVQAAANTVAASGWPLAGLVHNAGVGGIGVLQSWSDADLRDLFDTNVFGVHRLTRALLPALLAARGRIVCIGSQGGSVTMPFMGPYTMSKHALEAYAACLRQELAPHGVAVSIVQPGAVATGIGDTGLAGNVARLRATAAPFDTAAQNTLQGLLQPAPPRPDEPEAAGNRRHAPPESVARVVLEALRADTPQARYLVGTRWEGDRVINTLIERLLDAAGSPSHRLSEAELAERIASARRQREGPPL